MSSRTPHPPDGPVASLLADTRPYLSCAECFDHLDTYVERLVHDPSHDDLAMRIHLRGCAACADEAQALLELITDPRP